MKILRNDLNLLKENYLDMKEIIVFDTITFKNIY